MNNGPSSNLSFHLHGVVVMDLADRGEKFVRF
jgi:hypothetical protein